MLVAACAQQPRSAPPAPGKTCDHQAAVDRARQLRADGYLGRAALAIGSIPDCPGDDDKLLLEAEVLAELGLDDDARAAYRRAATRPANRAAARAGLRALADRPSATREPTADELTRARQLYRDGTLLRAQGSFDRAVQSFRHSYALAPHPLTIVQIALAHRDAGRIVEYRKANARALAIAEATRGARAEPRLVRGHIGNPSVALPAGGRTVLSAGVEGSIRVWDLASRRPIRELAIASDMLFALSVDDDATLAATCSTDGSAAVHDLATGRRIFERARAGDTSWRRSVLTRDGSALALLGNRRVELWDPVAGNVQLTIESAGMIEQIQLARADELILVRAGRHLRGYRRDDGRELWHQELPDRPVHMSAARDADLVAILVTPTDLELRTVTTGTLLERRKLATRAHYAALSPDGSRLALARTERSTEIQNLTTGRAATVAGQTDDSGRLHVWSPDSRYLAMSDKNGRIFVWDSVSESARLLRGEGSGVSAAALVPATDQLLLEYLDGNATVVDLTGASPPRTVARGRRGTTTIAVSADGARAARLDFDNLLTVWTIGADRGPVEPLVEGVGEVPALAFGPDGDLYAGGRKGVFRLDRRGQVVWRTPATIPGSDIHVIATEHGLLAGGRTGWLELRAWRDGALRGSYRHGAPIQALAHHRNGALAASAAIDGTVKSWRLPDGDDSATFRAHDTAVQITALAFDPSGRRLATGTWSRAVTVFDRRSGDRLFEATNLTGFPMALWFPAPERLAVVATDGPIGFYDLRTRQRAGALLVGDDGRWAVIGSDGAVDASDGAEDLLFWQVGDLQLPGFVGWQRQRAPGLWRQVVR